jgi:hypothetical protein
VDVAGGVGVPPPELGVEVPAHVDHAQGGIAQPRRQPLRGDEGVQAYFRLPRAAIGDCTSL